MVGSFQRTNAARPTAAQDPCHANEGGISAPPTRRLVRAETPRLARNDPISARRDNLQIEEHPRHGLDDSGYSRTVPSWNSWNAKRSSTYWGRRCGTRPGREPAMIATSRQGRPSRESLTRNWIDDAARTPPIGLGRRRALVVACSGFSTALVGREPAVTGCKNVGRKCDKDKDCCDGSRCKGDKKGKFRCKSGRSPCGSRCKTLDTDAANRGACGVRCDPGDPCLSGVRAQITRVRLARRGSEQSGDSPPPPRATHARQPPAIRATSTASGGWIKPRIAPPRPHPLVPELSPSPSPRWRLAARSAAGMEPGSRRTPNRSAHRPGTLQQTGAPPWFRD